MHVCACVWLCVHVCGCVCMSVAVSRSACAWLCMLYECVSVWERGLEEEFWAWRSWAHVRRI